MNDRAESDFPGNRFRRRDRLRTSADFDRVYRRRIRAADDTLLIFACRNQIGTSRLGISVSRKVGSAAIRNRWRRLIREAFRHLRPELPHSTDLVVIPRSGRVPDLRRIKQSLRTLSRRIRGDES